jgi:hypothetical protein
MLLSIAERDARLDTVTVDGIPVDGLSPPTTDLLVLVIPTNGPNALPAPMSSGSVLTA